MSDEYDNKKRPLCLKGCGHTVSRAGTQHRDCELGRKMDLLREEITRNKVGGELGYN